MHHLTISVSSDQVRSARALSFVGLQTLRPTATVVPSDATALQRVSSVSAIWIQCAIVSNWDLALYIHVPYMLCHSSNKWYQKMVASFEDWFPSMSMINKTFDWSCQGNESNIAKFKMLESIVLKLYTLYYCNPRIKCTCSSFRAITRFASGLFRFVYIFIDENYPYFVAFQHLKVRAAHRAAVWSRRSQWKRSTRQFSPWPTHQ